MGNDDKLDALHRLDAQARRLERDATGPTLKEFINSEMSHSHEYAGRSIFGLEPAPDAESEQPRENDAAARHVRS